jgi:hypothetical protein
MDPVTLAGAAVGLMVPYIKQLTGRFSETAGEKLAETAIAPLARLLSGVRTRFENNRDSYAKTQLEAVSARPENTGRQEGLRTALIEVLQEDQDFAAQLERLVAEAQQATGWQAVVGGVQGTAAIGGNVRQQASYLAGRDMIVKQSDPPTSND